MQLKKSSHQMPSQKGLGISSQKVISEFPLYNTHSQQMTQPIICYNNCDSTYKFREKDL